MAIAADLVCIAESDAVSHFDLCYTGAELSYNSYAFMADDASTGQVVKISAAQA